MRLLSSQATTVGGKSVVQMMLETPPNQPAAVGLNSTIIATLPAGGLIQGDSVSVQFVLGVQQTGSFRFFVIVEALP